MERTAANDRATDEWLIAPHGGTLKELYLPPAPAELLQQRSGSLPSLVLHGRRRCDLQLLLSGACSPLEGFLVRRDYERVLEAMRLADGTLWPMPLTLDVSEAFSAGLSIGSEVALRDERGVLLAVLEVHDIYWPDRLYEARRVFGSSDRAHPGVADLLDRRGPVYLGGRVRGVVAPASAGAVELDRSPRRLRQWFAAHGWRRIAAFRPGSPMQPTQRNLILHAVEHVHARLLLQPSVADPGDDRLAGYRALSSGHEPEVKFSPMPLATRMGGPREALWQAIVHKNHGASHVLVGRHHAGPGRDSRGRPFHGPFDAQHLVERHQAELGLRMLPFPALQLQVDRSATEPAMLGRQILALLHDEGLVGS